MNGNSKSWDTPLYAKRRSDLVADLAQKGIADTRVLAAMRDCPRHIFIEDALRAQAYNDNALPIGHAQTISQPYMVARMLELLELRGNEKVLEIGAGSGYVTALLSMLAGQVYAVERIMPLTKGAREALELMGLKNYALKTSDGTFGWPEQSPFDRIIVSAAAAFVPDPLLTELGDPGIMVIPVEDESAPYQNLLRIIKHHGAVDYEKHTPCVFVKLIGKYGYPD